MKICRFMHQRRSTWKFLRTEFENNEFNTTLEKLIAQKKCPDPKAELESVIRLLYNDNFKYRLRLVLIERCALDRPDLVNTLNKHLYLPTEVKFKQYLDKRISQKYFRQVPDSLASVRSIQILVKWFTLQRPYSSDAHRISDKAAEQTVIDTALRSFLN